MHILYTLTNGKIRLVVCTAWVMWHQSDLQNNCGGAINQIGSGINHCAEDIFYHCNSLTITFYKMLTLFFLFPFIRLFVHSSISLESGYRRAWIGSERCPFWHSFKMQVKVYRVAFMPGVRKLRGEKTKKTVRSLFFRLTSGQHFYFTAFTHHPHTVTEAISGWGIQQPGWKGDNKLRWWVGSEEREECAWFTRWCTQRKTIRVTLEADTKLTWNFRCAIQVQLSLFQGHIQTNREHCFD